MKKAMFYLMFSSLLFTFLSTVSCTKEEINEPIIEENNDLSYLAGDWMIPKWTVDFDGNTDTLYVKFNIEKKNATIFDVPPNAVNYLDGDIMFLDIKKAETGKWSAKISAKSPNGNVQFIDAEISKQTNDLMQAEVKNCPTCVGSVFIFKRL